MRVRILGSAAGGGFPQWNCACRNCAGTREGTLRAKPRRQTQIAVNAGDRSWLLLNASPDLRFQIESEPYLYPGTSSNANRRDSPISSVILTSADVDNVLGLLLLREFQPFHVHASTAVRRILVEDNSMTQTLSRVSPQVSWHDFACAPFEVLDGRVRCHIIPLGAHFPEYVSAERQRELTAVPCDDALVGLVLEDVATGGSFCFFPALPAITPAVRDAMSASKYVLLDGTFWSDDELVLVRGGGRNASDMGHIPISGPNGSLEFLRNLPGPEKIYIHINNTNPVLDENSAAHAAVKAAGCKISEDGMEFIL
jgi:pyrroloquinoline quinone biosynthesis protein B